MSYTPPVVFTNGTTVIADDLNSNNDALRKYINRDVAVGDLATDTFGTTDILKGEYANVVPDHQFTTGDIYTQNKLANSETERYYFSSQVKPLMYSQWQQRNQFQIIADTGKSIYFEGNNGKTINSNQAAKLIITGHIGVRNFYQYTYAAQNGGAASSYDYSRYSTTGGNNQRTRFWLLFKIEGLTDGWINVFHTEAQVDGFEEYQNVYDGFGQYPVEGTSRLKDRRVIPFLYKVNIPNLWAQISPEQMPQNLAWRFAIGCDSTIDLGWVNHRVMQYEVFYT